MGTINPAIYGAYLNGQNAGVQDLQQALLTSNRLSGAGLTSVSSPSRGVQPNPVDRSQLPAIGLQPQASTPQPAAKASPGAGLDSLARAQVPDHDVITSGLLKKSGLLLSNGDVEGAAKLFGEAHKFSEDRYKRDFTYASNQLAASNGQDMSGYTTLINRYKDRFGFEAGNAGFDPATGKLWMEVRKPGAVADPGDDVPTAREGENGEMIFSNPGAYKEPKAAPTQRVEFTAEELNNRLMQMADPEKAFIHFANTYQKAKERDPRRNFMTVKGPTGEGERLLAIGEDGRSVTPVAGIEGGQGGPRLSMAQQSKNFEIDAARKRVGGMNAEEIRKRTAPTTATGRENPLYDPALARDAKLAARRKIGADDHFDSRLSDGETGNAPASALSKGSDVTARFQADPAMKSYRLGKEVEGGLVEVLDKQGRVIGHFE